MLFFFRKKCRPRLSERRCLSASNRHWHWSWNCNETDQARYWKHTGTGSFRYKGHGQASTLPYSHGPSSHSESFNPDRFTSILIKDTRPLPPQCTANSFSTLLLRLPSFSPFSSLQLPLWNPAITLTLGGGGNVWRLLTLGPGKTSAPFPLMLRNSK